jgi:uncharacterized membrane protein YedE/YeeE
MMRGLVAAPAASLGAALGAGILFGVGLVVSQMIDPGKVLAFLDFAGRWDPSLALVMAGALAVAVPGFRLAQARGAPVLGGRYDVPASRAIDRRLIGGAAIFGVGWGLVGFCPRPAIAALAFARPEALVFVVAMLAGAWLYHRGRVGRASAPA